MDSPCLSAAGVRFSILPHPAGDLGLDLAVGLLPALDPADPIGVYTFRMGEMCGRGGCLLYAEVFGVLKPEPTTNPGANATTHHRLNRAYDDLLLFRRVDEDSLSFTRPTFA